MKFDKINSWAKINLSLNVIQKLPNKYHKIESLISFKRAGANAIITYFADQIANKLR